MENAVEKKKLRSLLRARQKDGDPADREKRSWAIAGHLTATDDWRTAHCVALYMSMPGEVETGPLLETAFRQGKSVYLPRVFGKGKMIFYPAGPATRLTRSAFGILEPPESEEGMTCISPHRPDIILVPGLAFDRLGYRLGYGGGYYDRFLAPGGHARRIGLSFAENLVPELPHETWDERMSLLCTEDGLIPVGR